jgi:hypothetical protein
MEHIAKGLEMARGLGRRYGPYLLVEALMPGGTLLALALYLYRRKKAAVS